MRLCHIGRGSGGSSWEIYLCVNTNQYKSIGATFGNDLSVEDDFDGVHKRIWSYSRAGGGRGMVQYFYFENGEGKLSPSLEIYTSEEDTHVNGIFGGKTLGFKHTP